MKVLKKADYSTWRHKFTCERCTSELEADPSDIRAQYHEGCSDPREPSGSYYTYHCTCPVCSMQHDVKESTMSGAMLHALQEKASGRGGGYYNNDR